MIVLPVSMQQMKDSNQTFFIELYSMTMPSGDVVNMAATDEDIMYNGYKFIAVPFQRQSITKSMDNITDSCSISVSDVDWNLLSYVVNGWDFRGAHCTIFRIQYPDSLTDPQIVQWVFSGRIDEPSFAEGTFSCKITQVFPEVQCPNRSYQLACNSEFGDAECGASLATENVAIVDVNENIITLGKSYEENYWRNGVAKCDGEARVIEKSIGDTITLNVNFLQELDGKSIELSRGCNKSVDDCKNRFDNLAHYSGFPAIPFESTYR